MAACPILLFRRQRVTLDNCKSEGAGLRGAPRTQRRRCAPGPLVRQMTRASPRMPVLAGLSAVADRVKSSARLADAYFLMRRTLPLSSYVPK
jgi:hypothetical protein